MNLTFGNTVSNKELQTRRGIPRFAYHTAEASQLQKKKTSSPTVEGKSRGITQACASSSSRAPRVKGGRGATAGGGGRGPPTDASELAVGVEGCVPGAAARRAPTFLLQRRWSRRWMTSSSARPPPPPLPHAAASSSPARDRRHLPSIIAAISSSPMCGRPSPIPCADAFAKAFLPPLCLPCWRPPPPLCTVAIGRQNCICLALLDLV
jgi:hypothetical protein